MVNSNNNNNNSRSKSNQTVKFGQLINYNMRNIFLEKLYTKCGRETIPKPISRNLKLNISLDWYISAVCFYCMPKWGLSNYVETKLLTTCFYLVCKAFLKNRKRSGNNLHALFFTWFLKKIISLVTLYELTKFHFLVAFTSWDIGQYEYCNCLITRLWRHEFWN